MNRIATALLLAGLSAAPALAVSLAATNPAEPTPAMPDFGTSTGGPPAIESWSAGSATLVPLMASDTPEGMPDASPGGNITISLSGDDNDDLRGYWDKLADGGQVMMPLEKQMWGDEYGMLTDRFGVAWMVNIAGAQQG